MRKLISTYLDKIQPPSGQLPEITKEEIEIDIPENKIIPLSGKVFATTGSTHSFTIENNGSNFKVLINNSTLSNAP